MNNKFIRTINLIGENNFNKLKDKHILILGLGGVGGYCLEAIVRSGVNNITIVDFDKIDETNINRQIIANISNIGEYKTEQWYKRIKSINPDCNLTIINEIDASQYYQLSTTPERIKIYLNNKNIDKILRSADWNGICYNFECINN